jgi:hypothetical protein
MWSFTRKTYQTRIDNEGFDLLDLFPCIKAWSPLRGAKSIGFSACVRRFRLTMLAYLFIHIAVKKRYVLSNTKFRESGFYQLSLQRGSDLDQNDL